MRPALGVCYYPEQWPTTLWEADARHMAETGLRYVRIGEFAWSRLEPTPGRLDFAWLLAAMDVLGAQGLKVIVGTPTATPPRWLVAKRPDMLALDAQGRPRGFGSRRHYCFSHPGYRAEAVRIVSALAQAVGQHNALAGWQTDNEYGCHDTTLSYSAAARGGFQDWLKQKYQDVTRLNTDWGNVFWSMDYGAFDEVELPNLTVTEANPAAQMDFRRYSSDQVAAFNRAQYDILKAARPDLPVLHNFMGRFTDFDHYKVAEHLDAASWDSYPLGELERSDEPEGIKAHYFRQGEPDAQGLQHDIYRAVGRGRWWVMEQQPGPVNWASHNADPLPGMVRLWAWEAFAHGAEVVSFFRWRQAPFAQEQMHAGLLRPDSVAAPALAELRQVAEEMTRLELHGAPTKARVGIVYDYESAWAWQIQPQSAGFSHHGLVKSLYGPLRKYGLDVDILPPSTADFSGYDLVLVPALFAWSQPLRAAVAAFDGHLLIGPRSGSKTADFRIPEGLPPDLPAELLAVRVTRVDASRLDFAVPVKGGGAAGHWRERLETDAEVVLEDEEGFAVLVRQGRRFYLGSSGDKALMQRVIAHMIAETGLPVLTLADGVRCRRRGGYRIYVNYGTGEATLAAAEDEAGYVIGGRQLAAAGVTVARLAMVG